METIKVSSRDLGYIQAALTMYIDYLRDGDEDEKDMATRVEATYEELFE